MKSLSTPLIIGLLLSLMIIACDPTGEKTFGKRPTKEEQQKRDKEISGPNFLRQPALNPALQPLWYPFPNN